MAAGAIPPGTTITQIAAGGYHSLALSSTGQVYAWGTGGDGQIGGGTLTTFNPVPLAVAAGAIPPGTIITQIAAGEFFSLALSSTGKAYAWGEDNFGQLGDGSTTASPVPVAVTMPPATTFTQIAAGTDHAVALSATGQMYSWGYNFFGQHGDGTSAPNTGALASVPGAVSAGVIPPGTLITQVSAGLDDSLALSSTGQIYAWGHDLFGQLGNGSFTTDSKLPVAVSPGAMAAGTTITKIAGGDGHSVALSAGGQVYTWGDNQAGQLGAGPSAPPASNLAVAVAQPAGTTISALAQGPFAEHVVALTSPAPPPPGPAATAPGLPLPPAIKPARPSNRFTLARPKVRKRSIVLSLLFPGSGRAAILATFKAKGKKVTFASRSISVSAGARSVTLMPPRRARSALKKLRRVTLAVRVTFTPTGGLANTATRSVSIAGGAR